MHDVLGDAREEMMSVSRQQTMAEKIAMRGVSQNPAWHAITKRNLTKMRLLLEEANPIREDSLTDTLTEGKHGSSKLARDKKEHQ